MKLLRQPMPPDRIAMLKIFTPYACCEISVVREALLIPIFILFFSSASFASEEDREGFFIERAIEYYISSRRSAGEVGIVDGIRKPVGPIDPYKSKDEFMTENPSCCRFSTISSEGYYPSFWRRFWTGYVGIVVFDNYFLRVNGQRIKGRELVFPMNSNGEVIVIPGINGD